MTPEDIARRFPVCTWHTTLGDVVACETFEPGHHVLKPSEMNMWLNQMVFIFLGFDIEQQLPDIGNIRAREAFQEWRFPSFIPGVIPAGLKKVTELLEQHINVNGAPVIARTFGLPWLMPSTPTRQIGMFSQGMFIYLFFNVNIHQMIHCL